MLGNHNMFVSDNFFRKVVTPPKVDDSDNFFRNLPKKFKQEWSCRLCKITTTSEKRLNYHIQGKKTQG